MKRRAILRAGWNRLRGTAAEHLCLRTGWDVTRPVSIVGTFHERCNYRCLYCRYWRKDPYADELPLAEWVRTLRSLRGFVGRYLIRFVGGEPFLRRDFLDLVEMCGAEGIDWSVCTNGSLLDRETVRRVVAARPFNLDLSVDSPDARIHDVLRGAPGSLREVRRAIGRLREERERTGQRLPIRLKPVITALNVRQLPALVDWAVDAGADTVDPTPVRPWTGEVERALWIRDPADRADFAAVVDELLRRQRDGAPIETPAERLRTFPAHFAHETVRHGASPCRVGLREFHIGADGEVRVCWWLPPIGSVREGSARGIWRGAAGRRRRGEAMRCGRHGSVDCANSCLARRTLRQEWRRAMLVLGQVGVLRPRSRRSNGRR